MYPPLSGHDGGADTNSSIGSMRSSGAYVQRDGLGFDGGVDFIGSRDYPRDRVSRSTDNYAADEKLEAGTSDLTRHCFCVLCGRPPR